MPSRWDHMREALVKCCTVEQLRRISRAEHAGATSAGCKEDMAAAIVRNRRRMLEGKPNIPPPRAKRRRSRLNRAEVARRSGVSLSFLSDLLGGLIAVPDGPTLPRIAKVLGVDVIDLLKGGY